MVYQYLILSSATHINNFFQSLSPFFPLISSPATKKGFLTVYPWKYVQCISYNVHTWKKNLTEFSQHDFSLVSARSTILYLYIYFLQARAMSREKSRRPLYRNNCPHKYVVGAHTHTHIVVVVHFVLREVAKFESRIGTNLYTSPDTFLWFVTKF